MFQISLNDFKIRYQAVHNISPGLVKRLIPYASSICADGPLEALASCSNSIRFRFEYSIAMFDLNQIHLVYQGEHMGTWRVFLQGFND